MADYKASPFYAVQSGETRVSFDQSGAYSTDDDVEIKLLDGLVPTWIQRVDEKQPEAKAPTTRKTSAK
ncbi:hypothetical protein [Paenibacillus planticolens]|uniref:Uncharacterized protein n=1 Tax=Paenibacillus planticolens TaxID=2654976 RepID=A0ABX1ZEE9_9BACL|nr:hypothetical protein [Paenibacillus planticolens]NOU98478.1 hypothetical protein [Paenibacillus planticolens]